MITQIFNTLNKVDASVKRAEVLMDRDISITILIDINNTQTKWTDNEKGFIVEDIYKKHFDGGLKDCLRYLQGFRVKDSEQFKGMDLNEIKYHIESEVA